MASNDNIPTANVQGTGSAAQATSPIKDYMESVVSYIPIEAVTVYLAYASLLAIGPQLSQAQTSPDGFMKAVGLTSLQQGMSVWGFIVFWLGSGLWELLMDGRGLYRSLLTTFAFAAWAYTLGGPFLIWGWYNPTLASAAILAVSFFLPMIASIPAKLTTKDWIDHHHNWDPDFVRSH